MIGGFVICGIRLVSVVRVPKSCHFGFTSEPLSDFFIDIPELISCWQSVRRGLRHLDAFKVSYIQELQRLDCSTIRTGSETTGAMQIVWRVLPYETITLKCRWVARRHRATWPTQGRSKPIRSGVFTAASFVGALFSSFLGSDISSVVPGQSLRLWPDRLCPSLSHD